MSIYNSKGAEAEYLALRGAYESLQIRVIAERKAIIPLQHDASVEQQRLREERLRQARAQLEKDETELRRLHYVLHGEEQ